MRLDLAHLAAVEPAQPFEAVGGAALLEVAQARHFAVIGRHHQLSADIVRDSVFPAELRHLADARNREPRSQRSRFVVEAAVQHAAVVSGLVLADRTFLFEYRNPGAGKPLAQPVSGGQSNDAAAD